MDDQQINQEVETETPAESLSEEQTTGDIETVNQSGAGTLGPDEAMWNSLSGESQDRFRIVTRQLNQERTARQAAEAREVALKDSQTAFTTQPTLKPEERDAVRKLNEDYGIATKDDVAKTVNETVNQRLGSLVYNMEVDRIEAKYDGTSGLPAFNRDEYENFIGIHPEYRNYKLEDVYEKMFPTEILQWRVKNFGKQGNTQRTSSTLRPTKTVVREEQWTSKAIEDRLNQPDGNDWYEKNQSLVNSVLAREAQE